MLVFRNPFRVGLEVGDRLHHRRPGPRRCGSSASSCPPPGYYLSPARLLQAGGPPAICGSTPPAEPKRYSAGPTLIAAKLPEKHPTGRDRSRVVFTSKAIFFPATRRRCVIFGQVHLGQLPGRHAGRFGVQEVVQQHPVQRAAPARSPWCRSGRRSTAHLIPFSPRSSTTCSRRSGHHRRQLARSATRGTDLRAGRRRRTSRRRPGCCSPSQLRTPFTGHIPGPRSVALGERPDYAGASGQQAGHLPETSHEGQTRSSPVRRVTVSLPASLSTSATSIAATVFEHERDDPDFVIYQRLIDGNWTDVTCAEAADQIRSAALGLISLGVQAGRPGVHLLGHLLRVGDPRPRDPGGRRGHRADLRDVLGRAGALGAAELRSRGGVRPKPTRTPRWSPSSPASCPPCAECCRSTVRAPRRSTSSCRGARRSTRPS